MRDEMFLKYKKCKIFFVFFSDGQLAGSDGCCCFVIRAAVKAKKPTKPIKECIAIRQSEKECLVLRNSNGLAERAYLLLVGGVRNLRNSWI